MTLVARRFASTPERTAVETWHAIVSLISAAGGLAEKELKSVSGEAAGQIADEVFGQNPVVVTGNGPRLRIYCVYGQDAVTGEDCNETALSWIPTNGDWKMFIPCDPSDLQWLQAALKKLSSKIVPYDFEKGMDGDSDDVKKSKNSTLSVNVERFKSL